MSEIGRWDYQLPSGVQRDRWETFSVGIFQWVKAKTKGTPKKGRVVFRITGYTADPSPVQMLAQAMVDRLNRFGIQYSDILYPETGSSGRRWPGAHWVPSATSCTEAQIAMFLINELVGAKKARCPFCESPYTMTRADGGQGVCLQCGEGFINNRKVDDS